MLGGALRMKPSGVAVAGTFSCVVGWDSCADSWSPQLCE
jgi:hypothetical protein